MALKKKESILKFSLLILLSVSVIFVAVTAWAYHVTRIKVLNDANEKAQLNLSRACDIIDGHLQTVEVAGYGLASMIMTSEVMHSPQGDYLSFRLKENKIGTDKELYDLIEQFVSANPHLWGAAMGFEPGVFPEYGEEGFAPFVRHADQTFVHFNLPDEGTVYRTYDWYAETKRLDRPRWSQPFMDVRGAIIACFCIPIHNSAGNFIGAIAVDLQLNRFTSQLLREIHPYAHSSVMLLDQQDVFLVHPKHQKIMKPLDMSLEQWNERIRQENALLYTSVMPSVDWTVALRCEENDIYENANSLMLRILKIVLLGILFILICSGYFFYRMRKVVARQARIESELNVASHIQLDMLPRDFPKSDNLHLSAILSPAKEVGGDLYDYCIKDNILYFSIGDVSGKGVPASLIMAITKSAIRSVVNEPLNVAEMMGRINNFIEASNPAGMFVTIFLGKLDLGSGLLEYCNAGHNPIVVVDNEPQAKFIETTPNIAAGVFKDFQYQMQTLQLSKGNRLILYTDGVTEAENVAKQFYGEERLLEWAKKTSGITDESNAKSLLADVKEFVKDNEQNDDITIMTVEI